MGKSRRLKAERRGESLPEVSDLNDQRRGQPAAVRVAQVGNRTDAILVAIAVAGWIAPHLSQNAALVTVGSLTWLVFGIAVGWRNPAAGLLLGLSTAPFISGPLSQPFAEFLRASSIWGSIARLLSDRLISGRFAPGASAPSGVATGAAILGIVLYPLTRITAQSLGHGAATGVGSDIVLILGGASLFFGSWIVASHLSRSAIEGVLRSLPIPLAAAIAVALLAWLKVPIVSDFAFDGRMFHRLAGLGFPTPTAMGLAVSLPLGVAALWPRNRILALLFGAVALFTIYLTISRGPLIALVVGGASGLFLFRQVIVQSIGKGLVVLGGLGGAVAIIGVAFARYGKNIAEGTIPGFSGDSDRVTSWIAGLQIAIGSPLVGGGWTSVRYWNGGELAKVNVNFSHNIVMQGLADGGLPLGLAMLTLVVTAVTGIWHFRKSISPIWVVAAITLLVCGAWDMPQLRTFGAVFGGVALGLVSRRDN
jgi:hypothetical protein